MCVTSHTSWSADLAVNDVSLTDRVAKDRSKVRVTEYLISSIFSGPKRTKMLHSYEKFSRKAGSEVNVLPSATSFVPAHSYGPLVLHMRTPLHYSGLYTGCGDVIILPYLCSLHYDAMLWDRKTCDYARFLYN